MLPVASKRQGLTFSSIRMQHLQASQTCIAPMAERTIAVITSIRAPRTLKSKISKIHLGCFHFRWLNITLSRLQRTIVLISIRLYFKLSKMKIAQWTSKPLVISCKNPRAICFKIQNCFWVIIWYFFSCRFHAIEIWSLRWTFKLMLARWRCQT